MLAEKIWRRVVDQRGCKHRQADDKPGWNVIVTCLFVKNFLMLKTEALSAELFREGNPGEAARGKLRLKRSVLRFGMGRCPHLCGQRVLR